MNCSCAAIGCMEESEDCHWGVRHIKRAGKDYKCFECGSAIEKGSGYALHVVFGGGTAQNYKVCPVCQDLIEHFFPNGWWFGAVLDNLRDYLDESWAYDLPSDCISQLTPAARARVCDFLQRYQDDQ